MSCSDRLWIAQSNTRTLRPSDCCIQAGTAGIASSLSVAHADSFASNPVKVAVITSWASAIGFGQCERGTS